jgi:hypothetical protein
MSFFGKSQTRKRKMRKMKETSRMMRATTMKRMTEATRFGYAVCVSGEGLAVLPLQSAHWTRPLG